MATIARAISAFARAVRDFFLAIFRPSPRDPLKDLDEAFSPIDVEEAKTRFNLIDDAVRFGQRGLPETADTTLDGPQVRVIQFVQDEVASAFRRANRELERLKGALKGRDVENLIAQAERLPDDAKRLIARDSLEANNRIKQVTGQLKETERSLEAYRARYGINRLPMLREPRDGRLLIAGALVIAVIQAFANALLFAQGMTLGLTEGLGFAVLLGVVDILFHLFLGRTGARVRAPEWRNRLLGAACIALTILTVPLYNLGVVHLRLSVRSLGFAQGMEHWWNSIRADAFGFTDFGSFALLIIGVICSGLAVMTGWSWDEPIPEMREAGRKLEVLRMEQEFWEERRVRVRYDQSAEAQAELERIQGQVEHNVRMAQALFNRIERLQQNLDTFVKDAERACGSLVQMYRDENRLARTTPAPSYFNQAPALSFEKPLHLDLSKLRQFVERQTTLQERLAQRIRLLHDKISESHEVPVLEVVS